EETIGNGASDDRREDGAPVHRAIGRAHLQTAEAVALLEPGAHRDDPRAPERELQEHHQRQLEADGRLHADPVWLGATVIVMLASITRKGPWEGRGHDRSPQFPRRNRHRGCYRDAARLRRGARRSRRCIFGRWLTLRATLVPDLAGAMVTEP